MIPPDGTTQAGRMPAHWRRVALIVAKRTGFRCEHRKRGTLGDALQDHGADFAFAFRGRSPVRP